MANRLVGVTVGSDLVCVVLLTHDAGDKFTHEDDTKIHLQKGERSGAYNVIHGQFSDYVRQHKANAVCIKGSAVSINGRSMAHLEAAELRGVVRAAASSTGVEVRM